MIGDKIESLTKSEAGIAADLTDQNQKTSFCIKLQCQAAQRVFLLPHTECFRAASLVSRVANLQYKADRAIYDVK